MDRVSLKGMTFYAHVGHTEDERRVGTHIEVDVDLFLDLAAAAKGDDIRKTVNYAAVHAAVQEAVQSRPFHLLETLAAEAAARAKAFGAKRVVVRVRKERPPITGHVACAEVEVKR